VKDELCECGWKLPYSVMPMPATIRPELLGEVDVLPDAMVTLRCPECNAGHVMYHPGSAAKVGLFGLGKGSGGKSS